jgi:hypothetical protein
MLLGVLNKSMVVECRHNRRVVSAELADRVVLPLGESEPSPSRHLRHSGQRGPSTSVGDHLHLLDHRDHSQATRLRCESASPTSVVQVLLLHAMSNVPMQELHAKVDASEAFTHTTNNLPFHGLCKDALASRSPARGSRKSRQKAARSKTQSLSAYSSYLRQVAPREGCSRRHSAEVGMYLLLALPNPNLLKTELSNPSFDTL